MLSVAVRALSRAAMGARVAPRALSSAAVGAVEQAQAAVDEAASKPTADPFSSLCNVTVADTLSRKGVDPMCKAAMVLETSSVFDAFKKMNARKTGSLVVMSEDEELRGIITERDYLHKVKVQGRSSRTTQVRDVMTDANRLITVTPDTQVFACMQMMTANKFRHMPVVRPGAWEDGTVRKDELMGMLSIGDAVFDVVNELGDHVSALETAVMGSASGGGAAALCRGTVGAMLNQKVDSGKGDWLHVREDDTVLSAITKMTDNDVGSLVVFSSKSSGSGDKLKGILTERDYLQKIIVLDRTSSDTLVTDIMTASNKLITVDPSAHVYDCLKVMTDNRIRHLPVVRKGAWDDGRVRPEELVGMVSIGDCVKNVVQELEDHVIAMEAYVSGTSY
jgi:CBS domain-containing protein